MIKSKLILSSCVNLAKKSELYLNFQGYGARWSKVVLDYERPSLTQRIVGLS